MRALRVFLQLARQEPAVAFFAISAVLLLVSKWWFPGAERRLPSDVELRARLEVELTARNGGRPPTQEEVAAAWPDFLDREVLYQEALALGLARDDEIVRRRLIQKMEFLLESGVPEEAEDESVLKAFYEQNLRLYTEPERVSFRHVFLGEEQRWGEPTGAVNARLAALTRGEAAESWSRPFLHGLLWRRRTLTEVERSFGSRFVQALQASTPAVWQGPVQSAFGWHLVFLEERIPERVVPFLEVRERVREDWREQARRRAREQGLARLRRKYGLEPRENDGREP